MVDEGVVGVVTLEGVEQGDTALVLVIWLEVVIPVSWGGVRLL